MNRASIIKVAASVLLALATLQAFAQKVTTTGAVKDVNGAPVAGAAVIEKGTTNGTLTDDAGRFSLSTSSGATLEISCIGYTTLTVQAGGRVDAVLKDDAKFLEEVVVVGYGSIRRSTLANSVATVKNEELVQGAVVNPLQMIQGKVAGLSVGTTSGDPNDNGLQMMLRGVSTLMSNQEPIIVVDGIIVGNLSNVSPDEVESVDVLKDGAAAAIYGTRGNNGVIIVTTKRGRADHSSITYHGYAGVESISHQVEVFTPEEYRNLKQLSDGAFTPLDAGANTNWIKEVFNPAFKHYHNVAINGGNGKNTYYLNGTIDNREGVMKGSFLNKYQISTGINQFFLKDKLQISANISFITANGAQVSEETAYLGARMANPTFPVYNSATGAYSIFAEVANPVRSINEFREDVNWHTSDISGKATYAVNDNLSLNAQGRYVQFAHFNGAYATKDFDENHYNGQAWRNTSGNKSKTLELFGQYMRRFGKHDLVAVAGYSYYDYTNESLHTYNYDFPTDLFEYNNMGLGLALKDGKATMSTGKSMNRLISFFGRANYSYADKYIAALSIREDGSSKFGPENRWGTFWSVSAAWRISQEDFLSGAGWLDELKLKVSYGVTGVEPSSPYLSKQRYSYSNPTYMDGKWIYTIAPTAVANPNLKWEEKHEADLGLDFAMFGKRLSGSLDLYNRLTKDLLYSYSVPVPPNLASTIYANVGSIENTGVELQLNGNVIKTSDWTLNISGNVSFNKNTIKSLSNEMYSRDYMEVGSTGSPVQKTTHIVQEGGAVGDFYGWESVGIKKNGAWKIVNADGSDGSYGSEASRHVIGNGIPKIFAGLSISAAWKGFDASLNFRGAFCYQILNQYRMLWETFQRGQQYNYPKTILEKPYGGDYYISASTAPAYVSYFLEDGDFVKLDNINLGYNFSLAKDSMVKLLRVYVTAQNFFTFTKFKGIDPEVDFTGLNPGVEYTTRYPTTKTISMGVKVGF